MRGGSGRHGKSSHRHEGLDADGGACRVERLDDGLGEGLRVRAIQGDEQISESSLDLCPRENNLRQSTRQGEQRNDHEDGVESEAGPQPNGTAVSPACVGVAQHTKEPAQSRSRFARGHRFSWGVGVHCDPRTGRIQADVTVDWIHRVLAFGHAQHDKYEGSTTGGAIAAVLSLGLLTQPGVAIGVSPTSSVV
jgi:hypothetical protein